MQCKTKLLRVEAEQWQGQVGAIDRLGLSIYPQIDSKAVFYNRHGLIRVEPLDWIVLLPCGERLILSDQVFHKLFKKINL